MAPALASRMDAAGDFQQELEDTAGTAPRQNKLSLINLQLMAMIGNASKPGTLCQVGAWAFDAGSL